MAHSFQSWWRVLNSWRVRVIAAVVFCAALLTGIATALKNVKTIADFMHIGKTNVVLTARTVNFVTDMGTKAEHIKVDLTIQKSGEAPLHNCKFEGWLANFGARLDYLPYTGSFSIPAGTFSQDMDIWLHRPDYMFGEYSGRLILSCDQVVSEPLTFPTHMPR
jgi:hypothetical protein